MEEKYMKRAIELAQRGRGFVNPNPMVGALVVKDKRIVGEGYHEYFGGPHAEVNAIKEAGEACENATLYVTLEPCNHHGKTPPCVDLIIKSRISKVVIGLLDPNPLMAGKSVEILKANGIDVTYGLLEREIAVMNKTFIKFMKEKRPYVIMKTAMTADGKIASQTGQSKWISGPSSRERVHDMRHEMMAIMVGIGTILKDNPSLDVRRQKESSSIIPVIVDSKGRIPLNSKVFNLHKRIIVATKDEIDKDKELALRELNAEIIKTDCEDGGVNLNQLMDILGKMKIDSVLLEGGSRLNGSAIKSGIVDETVSFVGPKVFGESNYSPVGGYGVSNIDDCVRLSLVSAEVLDQDVMIRWKVI